METKNDFRRFLSQQAQQLGKYHVVGGKSASKKNKIQISVFKASWLYLASDILVQEHLSYDACEHRLTNFVSVLKHADLMDVLGVCQASVDYLLSSSAEEYSWLNFKGFLQESYPNILWDMGTLLSPINHILSRLFCDNFTPECLKTALQFLRYGKKLHLESIGLEEKAITSYLSIEEELAGLDLSTMDHVLTDLNRIMRRWLRRLDLRYLVPNHGSGSVAEGSLTLYDKYRSLKTDLKLRIVTDNSCESYYSVAKMMSRHEDVIPEKERLLVRQSRTIFVPKTYSKLRTISMEPATLQYWQQIIMKRLYTYFRRHAHLKHCVKLEDQSYNQRMAKRGSIDNNLATIDLSAASDRISWGLVKAIFHRTPLMKWLIATRSNATLLPNGETINLRKFAPMGSALCFPVQCLIFAVLIEYIVSRDVDSVYSEHPGYAVYGDDMVVATKYADQLIEMLTALGFAVNKEKSFTNGKFRESCGKDYYDGIDVSSVYYRLSVNNIGTVKRWGRISPECYSAIVSACNIAEKRGYKLLRSYLFNFIRSYVPYFTGDVSDDSALYSPNPTNFHSKRRWHKDYQKWVACFASVISKPNNVKRKDDDDVAYFVRLAQMATRNSVKPLQDDVIDITLHGSRAKLAVLEREVCVDVVPL